MNQSNTSLAMDLSSGLFAYHLFGVLEAMHHNNHPCPHPDKIALEYLQIYHAEALEAEEADYNNQNFRHNA